MIGGTRYRRVMRYCCTFRSSVCTAAINTLHVQVQELVQVHVHVQAQAQANRRWSCLEIKAGRDDDGGAARVPAEQQDYQAVYVIEGQRPVQYILSRRPLLAQRPVKDEYSNMRKEVVAEMQTQ
jgi:hypothetical protein